MIPEPGIYKNLSMRDYHNAPAVNSRLVQLIASACPAAAWFASYLNPDRLPEATSTTMDAGSIAHALLLEGDDSRVEVIDPMRYPAKTTGAIPEGWTNQAIRAARDNAYLAGKIPVLKAQYAEVEKRVEAARAFIETTREDEPALYRAFKPDSGDSELSFFWDDHGTPCRIRPDRISADRKLIIDYKTGDGTAEPNTWGRSTMIRMAYYVSAAFYRRGIRALFNTECEYVFLVQENSPPYLCSLVGVDEQGFALGAAKVDYGLTLWRRCIAANSWPSYPSRVCYPEVPPWEVARWEEFEALGIPYDPAKLWQKPSDRYSSEDTP